MIPAPSAKQKVKQVTDESEQKAACSLVAAAWGLEASQSLLPAFYFFPGTSFDFQADLRAFSCGRKSPGVQPKQVGGIANFGLGIHVGVRGDLEYFRVALPVYRKLPHQGSLFLARSRTGNCLWFFPDETDVAAALQPGGCDHRNVFGFGVEPQVFFEVMFGNEAASHFGVIDLSVANKRDRLAF